MNPVAVGFALATLAMVVFSYLYYFRADVVRWRRERGPRRQIARELAAEREQELKRLHDELAEKYLRAGPQEPPAGGN